MKTRILTLLSVCIMALTSCTGSRIASAGNEVDDVYYNKDDRKADEASASQARLQAEAARVDQEENNSSYSTDRYDQGLSEKNGETESTYDKDPYADDDYYYSRQVRRFTSTSWNYYDPYYSYDPYYAIGTSTWTSYSNRPWWYDPYYYNGPTYAWTSNWGNGGYNYYPSQCFWNQSNNYGNFGFGSGFSIGIGSGYNPGFGYSPYGSGFGGYPSYGGYGNYYGGYGGYGGYGYYGGGCAPGYYGGNTYFGNGGSTSTTNVVNAPRNNPSSLNTSGRPGNQPVLNPRETRPYQGNYPVTVTQTRPKNDLNNTGRGGQPVVRPTNTQTSPTSLSRPNTNTDGNTRPTNDTYSRPTNDSYSRPTINNGTSRPTNDNYSRPRIENSNSRPQNETFTAPPRNVESRPTFSTPAISVPSHSGGSSPSGGGAVHRPR